MNIVDRFMEKVVLIPECTCWIWNGYTDKKMGYGMFWLAGTMRLSHRVSFELHKGVIADGLHVCHECDNPSCVNPAHLWLGSNAENVNDKVAKGRVACLKGEQHPMVKLNEELVRWIRSCELSGRAVAKQLGVDRSTIQYIRNRKLWSHVA